MIQDMMLCFPLHLTRDRLEEKALVESKDYQLNSAYFSCSIIKIVLRWRARDFKKRGGLFPATVSVVNGSGSLHQEQNLDLLLLKDQAQAT